jgi:NAD(P)-dependent dehydrogenase (short-subunit alcohol dehydrogenase family)
MYNLSNRVALVTGAAQGIGLGIALELAKAGSRIVVADRDLPKAEGAVAELHNSGATAIAVAVDVTNAASVNGCVRAALEQFSAVDVLVNNAGIHCEKLGQPSTEEHFHRCLDVNLVGVWRMTQALVPHFKARREGKIINIASIDGRKPWAQTPAYSASKAALINLTQSLAIDLGVHNINVNAVCPGGVMTGMADAFQRDFPALRDHIINSRPLKRALSPEDVGKAVLFFASSHAANITGQALNVDGGAVMN